MMDDLIKVKKPKNWYVITLIVLCVVLLLACGYFVWAKYFDKANDDTATETTQTAATATEETATTAATTTETTATNTDNLALIPTNKSLMFAKTAYAQNNTKSSIFSYDLVEQKLETKDMVLENNLTTSSYNSVGVNNSVQWNSKGNVIAYFSGEEAGMSGPSKPNTGKLEIINNNTKNTVIDSIEVDQVPKWILNKEGTKLYFLKTDTVAAENRVYSLYSYDIATKTTTKKINDAAELSSGGSSTNFYEESDASSIYVINKDSSTQKTYKVEYQIGTGSIAKTLISSDKDISADTSMTPSPDGMKFIYREFPADFESTIYLMDLGSETKTEIIKSGKYRSVNDIKWSSDQKSIYLDTTWFGTGSGEKEEVQLWKIDLTTKEKTVIDSNLNSIRNLGIAPDSSVLLYEKNSKYYLYTFATKQSKEIYSDANSELKGLSWAMF